MIDLAKRARFGFKLFERFSVFCDFIWQDCKTKITAVPRIKGAIQLADGCERDELVHAILTEKSLTDKCWGHKLILADNSVVQFAYINFWFYFVEYKNRQALVVLGGLR